jgi:thymidine kinase
MNSLSVQPAIDLIIGPMYASKSTELIRRLTIYHEMDMKVLYVNSSKDDRNPQLNFSTHNKTIGNIPYDSTKSDILTNLDISKYEVIGIDEAQLFSDLKTCVVKWVDNLNKIVIVCGLNGDFRREPFGQIIDLIPMCDSITKLEPFCLPCKRDKGVICPAHFTKRISDDQTTILIGGKDLYIPTCRKCYNTQGD